MISVIIPVKDALESFKKMWASLKFEGEIIIVDDLSKKETRDFINSLGVTVIRNKTHLWTNGSWNEGVKRASGDLVAVLNSDIILPKNWEKQLLADLRGDLVSPYYNSPFHQQYFQGMVNGSCYLAKKELFPIPSQLKHWCGDNWLSKVGRVTYSSLKIEHAKEQSAIEIDKKKYNQRIYEDCVEYNKLFPSEGSRKLIQITRSLLAKD